MSLHTTIRDEIKKAMLAKDTIKLTVMRGVLSAFTNELVAKGKKPQEELPDADGLAVIKRLVKQRKDSIEQFTKGGRADLAENERAEMKVLEAFLPATLSKDEIKKVAEKKKAELGATDKTKMGLLMKEIMRELKGQADGGDVKEVVEGLF